MVWGKIDNDYYSATTKSTTETYMTEVTTADLWKEAWSKAGKSLFYMQFIHPDVNWGSQKQRIEMMCYHLANEWNQHFKDTEENREWYINWIRKFDDEVENQC